MWALYTWQFNKHGGALSITRQVDVQYVAKLSKVLRKLALKQTWSSIWAHNEIRLKAGTIARGSEWEPAVPALCPLMHASIGRPFECARGRKCSHSPGQCTHSRYLPTSSLG